MLRYFTDAELACKCCGVVRLAHGFGEQLDALREAWGVSMLLTSACRCRKHNAAVGGKPNSFHRFDKVSSDPYYTPGTCAVDVSISDGPSAWRLAKLAMDNGWSVGVNKTFLHLDRRSVYTHFRPPLFTY